MGPKWQVNAATGLFPYPYPSNSQSGPIRTRLNDLNAAGITGNRFFVEAQYICGDDAGVGNKNNNATWREVAMTSAGTPPAATNFTTTTFVGAIHREQPAIYAWQAIDLSVTITTFDVPGDGRFILACKVTGTGPYVYEYALHNLNSHQCAGWVQVPLPGTHSALTNIGFHDVEAVGEPNAVPTGANPASDDWTINGGGENETNVTWVGPAHTGQVPVYTMNATVRYKVASFTAGTGNDHSANVLRWGTMFNYRFTSDVAPATGSIAVGLWRPGTNSLFGMTIATPGGATVPVGACCDGHTCVTTFQGGCAGGVAAFKGAFTACGAAGNPTTCCMANFNQANGVTVQDVFDFTGAYFAGDVRADVNQSGDITTQDVFDFIDAYFTGCS
jgi:hypothetical protein